MADFPLPPDNQSASLSVIGANQDKVICAVPDRTFDDQEIWRMKAGVVERLYAYGTVRYTDAFGHPHYSNFSQSFVYNALGRAIGFDTRRHNDAD
jgi:hypothetical protein